GENRTEAGQHTFQETVTPTTTPDSQTASKPKERPLLKRGGVGDVRSPKLTWQTVHNIPAEDKYFTIKVNGRRTRLQLDTASDITLISRATWKHIGELPNAFTEIKQLLSSNLLLTHYDPALPIMVAADASNYGIGAVISHVYPDGSEKATAYDARSITTTERN
ncbi:Gap-Pol polyprotein, partial [Schistosoma japonicum]